MGVVERLDGALVVLIGLVERGEDGVENGEVDNVQPIPKTVARGASLHQCSLS